MLELLEKSQVIKIVDNNPNRLPFLLVGFVVFYIIYSLIYIKMNHKRKQKLKELKHKIQTRHTQILRKIKK